LSVGLVAFAVYRAPLASAEGAAAVQQALSQAAGPEGPAFVAGAENLAHQLGLRVSDKPFTDQDIGLGAEQIRTTMSHIANLITGAATVAGLSVAAREIVKFKAHKDTPNQIPIGTPVALLFIAASLIFVPTVFKVSDATLFSKEGCVGEVGGIADFGFGGSPTSDLDKHSSATSCNLSAIVSPSVQQAKESGATQKNARGPLLGSSAASGINADFSALGLKGQLLDTYTQLGVLTAEALVAGARV